MSIQGKYRSKLPLRRASLAAVFVLILAGLACALPFTIFLLVFALIHASVVKMGIVKAIGPDGRRVPFAPTIAAALIGTFMLGCLERAPAHAPGDNAPQSPKSSGEVSPPQSR